MKKFAWRINSNRLGKELEKSVLENSVAISSQEKWEIINETVEELKLVERYTWQIVGETTGTASESDDNYETYEEALAMGRGWLHEIRSELREDEDYTVLVTIVQVPASEITGKYGWNIYCVDTGCIQMHSNMAYSTKQEALEAGELTRRAWFDTEKKKEGRKK